MKYKKSGEGEKVKKKDYSKTIIFTQDDFGNDGHMLQTVTIPPKTKQRVHYHHKQKEVFYILEGECLIYVNGKEYLSKSGDVFICNPGDKHNLWNKTNKNFKLIVFKIDMPESEDTVWEE
ncbi:cupin domain-containing protein [Patescibacteria group bacterium]|nr:cupin domain-containing protein [Patescibacteria group bacterium]